MSETELTHNQVFIQGRQAYWMNHHIGFNPYKPGSNHYKNWEAGWYDASDEEEHYRSMSR